MMMDLYWKGILLRQFGATLDMFENALHDCPASLWENCLWANPQANPGFSQFWYIAFHTLFYLDLYLTGKIEGFSTPPPYTLDELDPRGVLPG
jgi:hypothetical protein